MSCEPCDICERPGTCARVVTPEGMACRECADALAAPLRGEEGR